MEFDEFTTSSPNNVPYIAIGVVGIIIIIILIITAIAIGIVVYLKSRKRAKFRNTEEEALHSVKYTPTPDPDHSSSTPPDPSSLAPMVETQRSIDIRTNPAYGSAHDLADQPDEDLEQYVDVTSGQSESIGVYEEITKESSEDDVYVEEFLPKCKKDSATGQMGKQQFGTIDKLLEEVEKEDLTLPSHGRKNNPNYINSLDKIAQEIQKVDLASTSESDRTKTKDSKQHVRSDSDTGYVNDLREVLKKEEEVPSDEDEEGYMVYDPKKSRRIPGVGRPIFKKKDDDDIYENTEINVKKEQVDTAQSPPPQNRDHYVNDLQQALLEAQQRESEQETPTKRHHPYVNDITGLLEAAVREQEAGAGREEGEDGEGGEKRNYVNDIRSLLPSL